MTGVACALVLGSASQSVAALKIGLVTDKGGKDDKSFNASAYRGLMQAKDILKAQVKTVEAVDDNSFESLLRAFAEKDFDLVFAIGVSQAEALKKVAAQFPKKKFAIVDAEVNLPNVRSLLFQEQEGSYLVGAIAAMTTRSGKVGFIGGMDIPLIRRFQMGYEAGARKINPKIKITANYVGVTIDAWNNPAKAKELATAQYQSGADVIFHAAGASGTGLFDAAEEQKTFSIGVDSTQNWRKPGRVLTSMLKRVDVAVLITAQDFSAGSFSGGVKRYGLENNGVDYALDENNQALLSAETKAKVDALKEQIIQGKIHVPDYYQERKKK